MADVWHRRGPKQPENAKINGKREGGERVDISLADLPHEYMRVYNHQEEWA